MDRLTIPDKRIDEHTTRRTFIDASAVREDAMKFYWRLKAYEDTGLTPEEVKALQEQAKPERKYSIAEVIAGLRDLAEDRKCFFARDGDDEVFRRDYAVCLEAAKLLETNKGRLRQNRRPNRHK